MNNKEITITKFKLDDCKGNLNSLAAEWKAIPTVSDNLLTISQGNSAKQVNGISDVTRQVTSSFSKLLDNSIGFFTSVGISFAEADSSAANSYKG